MMLPKALISSGGSGEGPYQNVYPRLDLSNRFPTIHLYILTDDKARLI